MEDLNVQRSVSIEENTTNKMPTSEGNVDSVKEDHNAKTVSNSIEEKESSTSTEDKSSNNIISENSSTTITPPNNNNLNEETKVTSTTEKDEKKEDVLLLSEPKEDRPLSPQNEDSSGRPKRDRKPSSLLQDFDSGDSLVGGRKSKVSPTSHSPPHSPIPLSQRRKKTTSSESTSEIETTTEPTNELAANELVKLGSSFKEEENQNNNEASEEHKKSEASSSEMGSPMRVDEPVENEVESKKRSFDESPTDGDRAPKKIRLKYDENAHMQKLEKELKEERQKRKQVEDENQNLKQEVKVLRKQIAEQSKSSQGGSTVPVIQGFDTYITDERFRKAHQALLSLMKHKYGYIFNEPVDPAKFAIPDYFSVIKNPMDLGSIKRKLEGLAYSNIDEFAVDVNLVFSNAKTYNPPGTDVHMMADTLEKIFEKKMPGIKAPSSPAPTTIPMVPSTPPQVNIPTTPTAPASEEMAMMMKQISEMQANMNLMKQQFENLQQRKGPGRPPRVNSPLATSPPSPDYVAPPPRPGPGRPPAVERVKPEKKEKEKPVKVEKKVNKLSEEFLNSLPVKDKALITCHKIISSLMSHRYGYPFLQPVDPIRDGAHDYFNVIKQPMDFGTIHNKIEAGTYDHVDEFIKDTNLVFKNAKSYNAMGSDVYVMADTLQKVFEKKMISEKLMEAPPQPEVSRPAPANPPPSSKEVVTAAPDSPPNVKKAEEVKAMASQINTIRESMKQVKEVIGELKTTGTTNTKPKPTNAKQKKEVSQKAMSFEEKYELSQKLSELSPDQLGSVVQIIKEHQPNLVQEPTGEIEINLDILDTTTLRHLEKFVRDAQNKEKKKGSTHAKNEGLFGSGSESDTSSESE